MLIKCLVVVAIEVIATLMRILALIRITKSPLPPLRNILLVYRSQMLVQVILHLEAMRTLAPATAAGAFKQLFRGRRIVRRHVAF